MGAGGRRHHGGPDRSRGLSSGDRSDRNDVIALTAQNTSPSKYKRVIAMVETMTLACIRNNAASIEAVADALERCSVVEGEDLLRIIAGVEAEAAA